MNEGLIDKFCQVSDDAVLDSTQPIEIGTPEADRAHAAGVRRAIAAGAFGPCSHEAHLESVRLAKRHAQHD